MKKNILFIFSVLYGICSFSQLQMPPIFADGMVLQQEADVQIWGKAAPSSKVEILTSWDSKKYVATVASDSTWNLKMRTNKASYKTHKIQIRSQKEIKELNNVLLGEVWFCGGQSNMAQPLKGYFNQPIMGSLSDIVSSNDYLRCYTVNRKLSVTPLDNSVGSWRVSSPNTNGEFTAIGFYFGRLLQNLLNVPVAVINCSYGGSTIQAWMSDETLNRLPEIDRTIGDIKDRKAHLKASVLYNGMLKSVMGYGVKGCLWYQGEANIDDYKLYSKWFEAMHQDWIKEWNIGEFPIYFCQIAPFVYKDKIKNEVALFRETQVKIAETQKNTAVAILLDAGEEFCIHPANKKVAGERLSYIALSQSYGFDKIPCKSPTYKSIELKDKGKILVRFADAPVGLMTQGNELTGFELAGEDKQFRPAQAKIVKEGVEVFSDQIPEPLAVRYAFKNYFHGTLYGGHGLPVSSFRSDDWD